MGLGVGMGLSKQEQLARLGIQVYESDASLLEPQDHALIRAVAAMLVEATKPASKKTKDPEAGADFVRGRDFWNRMAQIAPDALFYVTLPRTHTAAGKQLKQLDVTEADVKAIALWLNNGGLAWMRDKPAWSQFVRNLPDHLARARAYEQPALPGTALDQVRKK